VIPADLAAELASAIRSLVAAGGLPAAAHGLNSSGTWRPAPGHLAGGYATSLPFDLGRLAGGEPTVIAARLAGLIRPVAWVSAAEVTGAGYLTITVTAAALASLAVRIPRAGAACARSAALEGTGALPPGLPDLAAEPSWQQAWQDQAAALSGRLAEAAGATGQCPATRGPAAGEPAAAGPLADGRVADAVAYAGADAVRYWLARMLAAPAAELGGRFPVSYIRTDPCYLVSFAHADAASVLRWAADLRLPRTEPDERLAGLLAMPAELELLGQLSWLAERVAGAARRGRPAELPRYLEEVAGAWLACRESCPALPFGGRAAPRDEGGVSARLWLADAARTVLATGLGLIGVAPRARL
jgi:arginyl-tRNA synthetase